jgi:hypothetical protein
LIRQALQRQEVILKDQFKFQKQLEAQSERKIMLDLITQLLTSVHSLTAKLVVAQYTAPQEVEQIREAWTRMDNQATVCRMALLGCEHLSREELDHFHCYLEDVGQLKQTNAGNHADYHQLKTLNDKHKDFLTIVATNSRGAIAGISSAA